MKNVILLTIDAARKDVFGCYGNESELTPFVDYIQNKCIRFTKAQAIGPYTQASFPGILTSSYYLEYGKPKGLAPRRTLISEALQKEGIITAGFHSNPYLCDFLGWNRGWDVFYDSMKEDVDPISPYIKGDTINGKVHKWLSSSIIKGEYSSFFLWLHYMDIHEPYIPGKKYLDMVDPNINLSNNEMYTLFKDVLLKRDASDEGTVRLLKKLYDAHVRETDDYVKSFFAILKKFDILKDSAIIITSDHGDEFNEHGGLSHDDKMFSELIDIPLFIYDPDKEKGQICDTLVSNIDIPPTIMQLFGFDPVENFDGHSLLPLADYTGSGCFGEAIDKRSKQGGDIEKDIYFYREGDLKIIYWPNLDSWEMYDLDVDPKEMDNIFDVSPKAEALKSKLKPRARRWQNK